MNDKQVIYLITYYIVDVDTNYQTKGVIDEKRVSDLRFSTNFFSPNYMGVQSWPRKPTVTEQ